MACLGLRYSGTWGTAELAPRRDRAAMTRGNDKPYIRIAANLLSQEVPAFA